MTTANPLHLYGAEGRLEELGIQLACANAVRHLRRDITAAICCSSAECFQLPTTSQSMLAGSGTNSTRMLGAMLPIRRLERPRCGEATPRFARPNQSGRPARSIHRSLGDFLDHVSVADAVSDLFEGIFGFEKTPVRLVIGVASLPLGMPVELESFSKSLSSGTGRAWFGNGVQMIAIALALARTQL